MFHIIWAIIFSHITSHLREGGDIVMFGDTSTEEAGICYQLWNGEM